MELEKIIPELRKQRRMLDITQVRLAEMIGTSLSTIKNLESGKADNPTWSTITAYAEAVGVVFTLKQKEDIDADR